MEQTKKNLKLNALLVLVFAGLSLIHTVLALIFANKVAVLPEGAPENALFIAKIVIAVVAVLLLAPQVFVGVRGFQVAKNPTDAKGHIVWAIILGILAAVTLIPPLVAIFQKNNISGNISTFCSVLVEVLVYFDYVRNATALKKEAN